jgi:hypothetical protein
MKKILTLVVLAFLTNSCSQKSASIATVTHEFWTAQQQDQLEKARSLTVKEDAKKTKLYEKIKIKTATFGEATADKDSAKVPTKLYLTGDKDISEVDFTTALDKTDKGWRVNMDGTKRSLYTAISKQVAGNMGNVLKQGLGGLENIKTLFGDFMEKFKDAVEKSKH